MALVSSARSTTLRAAMARVLVGGLLAALAGCGSTAAAPAAAPAPVAADRDVLTPPAGGPLDTMTWAIDSEPASLDWVHSYDYPSNTVLSNLCESLLRIDASFMPSPGLAERVDNPDPLVWIYRLRPGVRFHDGSLLTAEDAAYSLRRHMDPDVGSSWASFFRNVSSVEATGPLEVTVRLRRPDALFPQMMAVAGGVVGKADAVRRQGGRYGTRDGGVVCTGPYALERWTDDGIVLTRFDGYWDAEHAAKTRSVVFDFARTTEEQREGLLSGRLDGMFAPPLMRGEGEGFRYAGPSTSTRNLVVADLHGPLRDVRIRRALSMALDRRAFITRAVGDLAEPSRAVAAQLTWGQGEARSVYQRAYEDLPEPVPDLAAARALVQEAGVPARPVVLALTDNAVHDAIADAVTDAARAIGIDVRVRRIDGDDYGALFTDPAARKGVDLFHTTWYADVADPLAVYVNWQSGNAANYGGWKDDTYDAFVEQALALEEPVARAQLVTRLQARVSDQVLWIPLEQSQSSVWMSGRVTGAPTTNAYLYYPWAAALGAR